VFLTLGDVRLTARYRETETGKRLMSGVETIDILHTAADAWIAEIEQPAAACP
jgi:hypothetical protein